jgi:hypothetical protein
VTYPWLGTVFDGPSDLWPMRPEMVCPYCGRKGHVQRIIGFRVHVVHGCPGPWLLERIEEKPNSLGSYRMTIYHGGRERLDPGFADLVELAERASEGNEDADR